MLITITCLKNITFVVLLPLDSFWNIPETMF